jgi:hypothetical protein
MNADPVVTDVARCITARQDSGVSKHRGEHSAVLIEDAIFRSKSTRLLSALLVMVRFYLGPGYRMQK